MAVTEATQRREGSQAPAHRPQPQAGTAWGPQAPVERQRARAMLPSPPEGPLLMVRSQSQSGVASGLQAVRSQSPSGISSGPQAPVERQQAQGASLKAPPSSPAPFARQSHRSLVALLGDGAQVVDRGGAAPVPQARQQSKTGPEAFPGDGAQVVDRGDGAPGFQYVSPRSSLAPDCPSRAPRRSRCASARESALAPPPPLQSQAHSCSLGALFKEMALASPRASAEPLQQHRAWVH